MHVFPPSAVYGSGRDDTILFGFALHHRGCNRVNAKDGPDVMKGFSSPSSFLRRIPRHINGANVLSANAHVHVSRTR